MTTFVLEVYELHTEKYKIEANSKAEAVQKFMDGEGDVINDSLEYIEQDETRGMPTEWLSAKDMKEFKELDLLDSFGDFVPCIRSFTES